MHRTEQQIEEVLNGLRDAAPPKGMEQRLRACIAARQSESARTSPFRFAAPRTAVTALGALAAAAVMIAVLPHHAGPHSRPAVANPMRASEARVATKPRNTPVHTLLAEEAVPSSHGHRPRTGQAELNPRSVPQSGLTEQQHLLLQVAEQGDAGNLAMLNEAEQARQLAQQDHDFKDFFALNPEPNRKSPEGPSAATAQQEPSEMASSNDQQFQSFFGLDAPRHHDDDLQPDK